MSASPASSTTTPPSSASTSSTRRSRRRATLSRTCRPPPRTGWHQSSAPRRHRRICGWLSSTASTSRSTTARTQLGAGARSGRAATRSSRSRSHNTDERTPMNDEKLTRRERELRHQLEVADERLKQAHRVQGRQGQKIAELRGELARTREEHSKLDRGELRKLENFAE